jgi:hypothetical protein
MQEEHVRHDARKNALKSHISPLKFSLECNGRLTSPAAETNPEIQRAASSSSKVLALAVQIRTANSAAVDMSMTARLPNLTDSGTQTKFPSPRRRKLN